jgi:hypothetical protein
MAYLGTNDPSGWVIMDGSNRNNSTGIYNNLINANIGKGTINGVYSPPNYKGAFLRGIGSGQSTSNSGPVNIDISQNEQTALVTHNHAITINDPGHNHNARYKPGIDNSNFDSPDSYLSADKLFDTATTNSEMVVSNTTGITATSNNTTVNQETRPYNFGVNWILKL